MQSNPGKSWKWIKYLLLGVSCVCVLILMILGPVWLARQKIKKELAEVIAAEISRGSICSLEELNTSYKKPAQDATADYLKAFALMKVPPLDSNEMIDLFHVKQPKELPSTLYHDLRQRLIQTEIDNREFLKALRAANQATNCRYPVDLSKGWDALLKHLPDIRNSMRILVCLAWLDILQERPNEALAKIEDILLLGKTLDTEPTLISQLIKSHALFNSAIILEKIYSHPQFKLGSLDKIETLLAGYDTQKMMVLTIKGERCIYIDILTASVQRKHVFINQNHDQELSDMIWTRAGLWKLEYTGAHERDLILSLDFLRRLEIAAQSDHAGISLENLSDELQAMKTIQPGKTPHIIPGMLLPGVMNGINTLLEAEAMKRILLTTITIHKYQLKKGNVPFDLEDLMPDFVQKMPVDPFTSESMIYHVKPRGYRLYSVGRDGEDNEGLREQKKAVEYDVAFDVDFK